MEHLLLLGRGLLALVIAAVLLVAAQRRQRGSDAQAPTDIGLD